MECGEEFVGTKEIQKEWRLVPYIRSDFSYNKNDLKMTISYASKE